MLWLHRISKKTKQNVIDFLINYGEKFLGKTTICCKDTPAFIANRIGIANIASLLKIVEDMNLTVEETDALTGPVMGIPKSATFIVYSVFRGCNSLTSIIKCH